MNNKGNGSGLVSSFLGVPVTRKCWSWCLGVGGFLWLIAVILWLEGGLDQAAAFYYDEARVAGGGFLLMGSRWLSSNGMAAISILYVLYLIASYQWAALDAPKAINFYVICSMAISGIAGDMLKLLFQRARPGEVFSVLTVFSSHNSPAMPSGHATKAMALAVPFILLASHKSIGNKVMKVLVSLIAIGVAFSRVVLGAHFVSDVVAGMGMAIFGLPFTMLFANLVVKQVSEEKLPRMRIVWGVLLVVLTVIFMMI